MFNLVTTNLIFLPGMMDLIGYPEHVLNSTWLNRQYEEVDVSPDYLMNIIAFQSYKRKEGMRIYIRLVLEKIKRLKFFDKKWEYFHDEIWISVEKISSYFPFLDHMREGPGLRYLIVATLFLLMHFTVPTVTQWLCRLACYKILSTGASQSH